MRPAIIPTACVAAALSLAVLVELGCSSQPSSGIVRTPQQQAAEDKAAQAAQAQATQLSQAMRRSRDAADRDAAAQAQGNAEPGDQAAPVQWLDNAGSPGAAGSPATSGPPVAIAAPTSPLPSSLATEPEPLADGSVTTNAPASIDTPPEVAPEVAPKDALQVPEDDLETADAVNASATPPTDPAALSRDQLVSALGEKINTGDATPVDRAMRRVLLSLAVGQADADPAVLSSLPPMQQDRVARFQQVVQQMTQHLHQPDAELSRQDLAGRLDELFGAQPISIRGVQLCKRVSGYGVYDPFADHTFLAGEDHRMIVYTELDHFRSMPADADRYEVRLKQEVILFTDTDGLIVWKHDPVQILDRSRNPRRDFFTIQMITLPKRLSVGKYRLKVSVTDQQGGSIDETSIPLRIVADSSLAKGGAGGTGAGLAGSGTDQTSQQKMDLIRSLLGAGDDDAKKGLGASAAGAVSQPAISR